MLTKESKVSVELFSLLSSDPRFVKSGNQLKGLSYELVDAFSNTELLTWISENLNILKNTARFLNILLYANKFNDFQVFAIFRKEKLREIITTGEIQDYSESLLDVDLKDELQSDYIDYKELEIEVDDNPFLASEVELCTSISSSQLFKPAEASKSAQPTTNIEENKNEKLGTDYWIKSVQLDFAFPPQPNGLSPHHVFEQNNIEYCIYDESVLPWNQSQISVLSDVNKFSKDDILNLFPPIRLYTRSPFMYQKYEGLDYDEDLGVIFKIKGFTKKQFIKNLIEFPHLEHLDRVVRRKGEETTLEFWKHIEINGEIYPTASIWDKLEDTKKLPKTESFMNEYVTRRYILECQKGIEHKYPMRGSLESFITLYAPPSYYEEHKYDPIEIGKKCIQSRISFKRTRNPILKMINNEELSLQ